MSWIGPAIFCVMTLLFVCYEIFIAAAMDDIARQLALMQLNVSSMRSDMLKMMDLNPHAHLLGKTVEYRKFEASDWQRGVVWCVGIHGGLCIRDAEYLEQPGKWIDSDKAVYRVREVEP